MGACDAVVFGNSSRGTHPGTWKALRSVCKKELITLDITNAIGYHGHVIRSFRSKETEKIWDGEVSRRLPIDIQRIARRKLRMLNNSNKISDLLIPPSNRLEALKGDRKGQYSIRINAQWRICFEWLEGDCCNVEIVDYH